MLFLDLLYLHQLIKYPCRCFFLLICKNMHPQLAFSLSCRYSTPKKCIYNLLFLCLADTPHPIKCIRNLLFLCLADTPHPKSASATCLFSVLQILPCKNLHLQLAFSLSCRYSPTPIHFFYLNYSGFLLDF